MALALVLETLAPPCKVVSEPQSSERTSSVHQSSGRMSSEQVWLEHVSLEPVSLVQPFASVALVELVLMSVRLALASV